MKNLIIGFAVACYGAVMIAAQVQVPPYVGGLPVTVMPLPSIIRAADGSLTAPSYSFASAPTTGFYNNGGGEIDMALAGVRSHVWNGSTYFNLSNTAQIALGASSDLTISRVAANEYGVSAVLFAALGTPANGTFAYCSDCTIASPCAGAGTGAFAKRLNGQWVCN